MIWDSDSIIPPALKRRLSIGAKTFEQHFLWKESGMLYLYKGNNLYNLYCINDQLDMKEHLANKITAKFERPRYVCENPMVKSLKRSIKCSKMHL
jgi:hypothetical protein